MKSFLKIGIIVGTIVTNIVISCIKTQLLPIFNESDEDIILVYQFNGDSPYWTFCKKNDYTHITLSHGESYAHRTPLTLYVLKDQPEHSHPAIMDGLEEKIIQKYIMTYDDIEYLRESKALTFPPTEKMKNVEMDPPLSQWQ